MTKLQAGFTLVELLIVIGILAVLAAVALPVYSRLFGSGASESAAAELTLLQDAMSAMMAEGRIGLVDPQPEPVDQFQTLPTGPGVQALFPSFLRSPGPTFCSYTWQSNGLVTQVSCGAGGAGGGHSPPGGEVGALLDSVAALEGSGALNQGQANALSTKLEAAQAALDAGDTAGAVSALSSFTNQVNAFLNADTLQPAEAQPLLDAANGLIQKLGGGG